MKLETREDIIQLFMTELDNSAFKNDIFKVISREEIEELLKQNIKGIKYADKDIGNAAEYDGVNKVIIINKRIENIKTDNREKLNKIFIIHEMWHSISNRITNFKTETMNNGKVQVLLSNKNIEDINNEHIVSGVNGLDKFETVRGEITKSGIAFTEGMTQLMAERMLGYSLIGTYQIEKEVMIILENLTSRENMISDYIYGTSKIEEDLYKKYGEISLDSYRYLRTMLDSSLEITKKLVGEIEMEDGENEQSLLDEQKSKRELAIYSLESLIQKEKKRVEETNTLKAYEEYDKLLKSLNYAQSEEIKSLERFDLEEETKINEKRLAEFKKEGIKNREHDMKVQIENATSEVTISQLNNQINNVSQSMNRDNKIEQSQKEI